MILSPLNVFDRRPIFTQLQLLRVKNKSLYLQSKHLFLTLKAPSKTKHKHY